MKIALAQMNSSDQWRANLLRMKREIRAASKKGAQAVFFPENTLFMGPPRKLLQTSRELHVPVKEIIEEAKRNRIAILLGSFPEVIPGKRKVFNTSLFIDERGTILGKYRKIHLFNVVTPGGDRFAESDYVRMGEKEVVFSWRGYRWGMSICYDLRFPEHFRNLKGKGAQILLVPSAFTAETGKAHWHTLLRARAIENYAFVLAPAQTGNHAEKRKTYGHTIGYGPWGEKLLQSDRKPGVRYLLLQRDRLLKARKFIKS